MVGNEKGNGHKCRIVPELYCPPECPSLVTKGISLSQCSYTALAYEPCTYNVYAKDQATAEARAASGLYDPKRMRISAANFAAPADSEADRVALGVTDLDR